jgi:alginate O-acetyltransferase complex protein AlgJ
LFFRRDCEFVEGPGFADPTWIARRHAEGIAGNAAAAVLDLHRQLAARGIALVVLPVPVKPMVEGHALSGGPVQVRANRSFFAWIEGLRAEGVEVLDVVHKLVERERASGAAQYLQTDTHWRPEAMGAVAVRVAERVRALGGMEDSADAQVPVRGGTRSISAHGDTLALLGLRAGQRLFAKETVEIAPVSLAGRVWKAEPGAEVLVLGDSFTNIYSLGAMGWGESAGFAEQLSVELRRPVDVMARNSDGAVATRTMLQRELAAGRDRLRGKRVVVWEFAARELAFGDWRTVALELGQPAEATFFAPPPGGRLRVQGTVAEVSSIPQPESVPYREHIVSVRLVDVVPPRVKDEPASEPARQMLVYAWSFREREFTSVARLRPGDRVAFEVRAWDDVAGELEKFQRSEFADPLLAVEPPVWGEPVEGGEPAEGPRGNAGSAR